MWSVIRALDRLVRERLSELMTFELRLKRRSQEESILAGVTKSQDLEAEGFYLPVLESKINVIIASLNQRKMTLVRWAVKVRSLGFILSSLGTLT